MDDGVVGKNVMSELNVPIKKRIEQLLINMERMRWMPNMPEGNGILVNIPQYELHVWEEGKIVFAMDIVVGKTGSQTVIFADEVLTMVRRLQRGERLSVPHRTHVYQLLVRAGVSHRRVASLYGALAIVPAIWAIIHPRGTQVFWIGSAIVLATVFFSLVTLRRWAERRVSTPADLEDRQVPA